MEIRGIRCKFKVEGKTLIMTNTRGQKVIEDITIVSVSDTELVISQNGAEATYTKVSGSGGSGTPPSTGTGGTSPGTGTTPPPTWPTP